MSSLSAYADPKNVVHEKNPRTHLLCDLFGNHFPPVTLDPSWLTLTVKSIAQAIYTERSFPDLSVLADALDEVGCTNADILNHSRHAGDHPPGCWTVDFLLGKK
jgi:hypothetical protein